MSEATEVSEGDEVASLRSSLDAYREKVARLEFMNNKLEVSFGYAISELSVLLIA